MGIRAIKGINDLSFCFSGSKIIDGSFKLVVDEKEITLRTNYKLDKDYVYNRILKQKY